MCIRDRGYGALTGGNSDYLSNNITLEVSGADPREISAYTDRIVERLRQEPALVEVCLLYTSLLLRV